MHTPPPAWCACCYVGLVPRTARQPSVRSLTTALSFALSLDFARRDTSQSVDCQSSESSLSSPTAWRSTWLPRNSGEPLRRHWRPQGSFKKKGFKGLNALSTQPTIASCGLDDFPLPSYGRCFL